jgi:hypothetical protein
MRTHPTLLLVVGLTLGACDETGGPSTDASREVDDLQAVAGPGTIRVRVRSSFYSLMGLTPIKLTLDGKVHDLQVRDGRAVTRTFGGLSLGTHRLQGQFTYNFREWIRCHSAESLRSFTQTVKITGADTVRVVLEIVSSVHCHFR